MGGTRSPPAEHRNQATRAFSKSVFGLDRKRFEEFATSGKRTSVRPEPVEGLFGADFEKSLLSDTTSLRSRTYVL